MCHSVTDEELHRIHSKHIKLKMFRNVIGFLRGIVADRKINTVEIEALHLYMIECVKHFQHGDIIDILDMTETLVEKTHIGSAEEADLLGVIDCIIEYQSREYAHKHEKLEEFLGMCSGIVADDIVNLEEAIRFREWINQNAEFNTEWPYYDVARRIDIYLQDQVLDAAEAEDLRNAIKHLVGGSYMELGATSIGLPTTLTERLASDVHFSDRTFCFTGKFFFGSRSECEEATEKMGGVSVPRVTRKLNYLVVGSIASPFWLVTHFGTKIKKVMSMEGENLPFIVGEDVWRQSLSL